MITFVLLLTMFMDDDDDDVLWLVPLFFDDNASIAESTFGYRIHSLLSNLAPSLTMSTSNSTSIAGLLPNSHGLFLLKWTVRIIGGLLIIVGGIGNTLSAMTLSRKKLRVQVTSIYLIALALSDLGRRVCFDARLHATFSSFMLPRRQRFLQRLELLCDSARSQTKHASRQ